MGRTRNSRTKFPKVTARSSCTNAMRSLPGWTLIRLLKKMSTRTSRRRSKASATPSLPNCIELLEVLQVELECLVVCQEACPEVCLAALVQLLELDLLLKKLIKISSD